MEPSYLSIADDGWPIATYVWEHRAPVGVVVIAHGMVEHARRYERLASFLVEAGYAVVAPDHRGHGRTSSPAGLGHFADANGWDLVCEDVHRTICEASERWGVPVVLFGHSMGSLIARSIMLRYPNSIAGAILSGTAADPGLLGRAGSLVAAILGAVKGVRAPGNLLNTMSFGGFNKRFRPNRTQFDWLSRDASQVDTYIADPLCGAIPSVGFFSELLRGMAEVNDASKLGTLRAGLPILMISGDADPVGHNGDGVEKVRDALVKAGAQVSLMLYPNARHELLNETNADEVQADIRDWLDVTTTPKSGESR